LEGDGVGLATALTAQGVRTFASRSTPPSLLRAQLAAVLELGPVDAVKLGMVPGRSQLRAIRQALGGTGARWVVDPVVRTSRGEPLSALSARDYLDLAGPDVALTPNLDEAAWLLGDDAPSRNLAWAEDAAARLGERGFGAVVVKGGHLARGAVDVLCADGRLTRLEGPRLRRSERVRGTGCRFASALAVEWARRGGGLADGAARAKAVVAEHLRAAGAPAPGKTRQLAISK
jgi:hydroxymethylpyrimidine/phosphomethylpyrimidine kinase